MSKHWKLLRIACEVSRLKQDDRRFFIGAVGIRNDGTMVAAYNGAPKEPTPEHHCEFRLCRKLDKRSVVYVARTLADGSVACAKPCKGCMLRMISCGVSKVYYTI